MTDHVFFAAASTCAIAFSAPADVVLQDDTFNTAEWALENVLAGPSGVAAGSSAASQSVNGNPGTARQVMVTVGPLAGDSIGALSRFGTTPETRYEPIVQGAIASVTWTIDANPAAGATASLRLGMKQGQTIYFADPHALGAAGQWATFGASGLTSASFSRLDGGAGSPNFTAAGAPIRFGFVMAASSSGQAFTSTADFDNFSVTIVQVPGPGSAALAALGLAVAARRKRSRVS